MSQRRTRPESYAELRRRLMQEGEELEEDKQFSIKFSDGKTLYMQPEKMDINPKTGDPILKPKEYIKKHHPERVDEYDDYLSKFNKAVSSWFK